MASRARARRRGDNNNDLRSADVHVDPRRHQRRRHHRRPRRPRRADGGRSARRLDGAVPRDDDADEHHGLRLSGLGRHAGAHRWRAVARRARRLPRGALLDEARGRLAHGLRRHRRRGDLPQRVRARRAALCQDARAGAARADSARSAVRADPGRRPRPVRLARLVSRCAASERLVDAAALLHDLRRVERSTSAASSARRDR